MAVSAGMRRSIRLTPQAVEALERHRKMQDEERSMAGGLWQEHGLVFPSTARSSPLLRRAGLEEIRFHDLRHTFGSLMLDAGEHPKVVQEILGHSQISQTMGTYFHVLPDILGEAMGRSRKLLP